MSVLETSFQLLTFPFTKKGWTHEMLQRKGPVVLVRRHKRGTQINFEVVKLRQRRAETFHRAGREISLACRETYPLDEDWGTYGFTYQTLAEAERKFVSLCQS